MSGKLSKAPAYAMHSRPLRLITFSGTRSSRSKMSLNGPPSSRMRMMALMALGPMPLMPPRPKRISPFLLTVKVVSDSLMSGPSTLIFARRQSSISLVSSSMSFRLRLMLAAMNSAR